MADIFKVEFSDSFGPKALAVCATFDDYDGAPDGGHSLGLGYDKLDAAIDLLGMEGENKTVTIDLMDTPYRETMTGSVNVCLARLEQIKSMPKKCKSNAVGGMGECLHCGAENGEECKTPAYRNIPVYKGKS